MIPLPGGMVLSEGEMVIVEGIARLVDRGFCTECAVKLLLGIDIPEDSRSPAPCTEGLLIGDFLVFLLEAGPPKCDL